MPGTNTTEYKIIRKSLVDFHDALKRFIPGLKFEDIFFEVFSCHETDTEILEKTDFHRYSNSYSIVNGLTKTIVDFGGMS